MPAKQNIENITRYAGRLSAMGTESRLRIMQLLLAALSSFHCAFFSWRGGRDFSPMRAILWAPSGRPEMKRGKTNEAWLALQTKHQSDADQSLAKWNLLGKRISSVPA
jgi:hypothetical protein